MRGMPTQEPRRMLEEELDPRPPRDFPAAIAAHLAGRNNPAGDLSRWLNQWVDRDDLWRQLRGTEHWISRAGA